MSRIRVDDLVPVEELTPEQQAEIFGAGRAHQARLGIESLEERQLLAVNLLSGATPPGLTLQYKATYSPADHVLRIEGSSGADSIHVEQDQGLVSLEGNNIQIAGTVNRVNAIAAVKIGRIQIDGKAGDDNISLALDKGTTVQIAANIMGGDGNDTIVGGGKADFIVGGAGNDTISGMAGADTLWGAAGNDRLFGGLDADSAVGGLGNDVLSGNEGNDIVMGAEGEDKLFGDAGHDILFGGVGKDELRGGEGDDLLQGNDGYDFLAGGAGNDRLLGGTGDDQLEGDDGDDSLSGDAGKDTLVGGAGNDILTGGDQDDLLYGGAGNDRLDAGKGNDYVEGGDGEDTLLGNEGNDRLFGDAGNDRLDGGAGDDGMEGNAGNDTLRGGTGNDVLTGDDGNDTLMGEAGNDDLSGGAGLDLLDGGAGNDVLRGGANPGNLQGNLGDDRLEGNDANDLLDGGDGNDFLDGGAGNDKLYGRAGNDVLKGGGGSDLLVGGAGFDVSDGVDDVRQALLNKGLTFADIDSLKAAVTAAVRGPEARDLRFKGAKFHVKEVVRHSDAQGITYEGRISHVVNNAPDDQIDYRVRVEDNGTVAASLKIDRQGFQAFVKPAFALAFYFTPLSLYVGYVQRVGLENVGQLVATRIENARFGNWQDSARFMVGDIASALQTQFKLDRQMQANGLNYHDVGNFQRAVDAALTGPKAKDLEIFGYTFHSNPMEIARKSANEVRFSGRLDHVLPTIFNRDDHVKYSFSLIDGVVTDLDMEIDRGGLVTIAKKLFKGVASLTGLSAVPFADQFIDLAVNELFGRMQELVDGSWESVARFTIEEIAISAQLQFANRTPQA